MKTAIPAAGVKGTDQIRLLEATSSEFRQILDLVSRAVSAFWRERMGKLPTDYLPVWVESLFADRVVVRHEDRYWQHAWRLNDANQVELAAPVEVVEQYAPVVMREAAGFDQIGEGTFIETIEKSGLLWDVVLIRAGLSKNGTFYPDAVLREAAPLFEGVRAFIKADAEHVRGEGKDARQIVGWFSDCAFVEGAKPDTGRVTARFNVSAAEDKLRTKIVDAWNRGKKDLVGLSIDADGKASVVLREGKKVRQAKSITKVNSVDVIVDASAGGEFIRLVESEHPENESHAIEDKEQDDMKLRESMINKVKSVAAAAFGTTLAAKYPDPEKLDDAALEAAYREAVAAEVAATGAATPAAQSGVSAEDLRMVEARINGRSLIATCGLPAPAIKRLQAQFETRAHFTEADVQTAITEERDYLARMTESGHVVLPLEGARTEDRAAKVNDMLDAFFDPEHKDHATVRSFKECYIEITGDKRVTGRLENIDRNRFAESTGVFRESLDSASWANVLGNSITRQMLREYTAAVDYDAWRRVASVVPVQDFRSNERLMIGGYGDLPIVAQGAPYTALSSPTDEKATYAIEKRGGTEDITLEMIKNDDVSAISRVPVKLGRAAKRTLAKFVFDFIRNNPTIYDGVAWFHASHNNLQTAALDATSLAAHRLLMLKQTELSSSDRIGIAPKSLIVPVDLQEAAVNLFNRNTNNDKTFIQTMTMDIIPVWYWTDANDWATMADPRDIPGIEVGFLDGQQDPQLFVQDNPSVGSMFSNDKLTYKIRHIYGGAVTNFRAGTKAVVA